MCFCNVGAPEPPGADGCLERMQSETTMNEWQPASTAPEGIEVETKIDPPGQHARNVQNLVYERNLWWFPDRSMYVYYTPTHWRPLET